MALLDEIVANKLEEVAARKQAVPFSQLQKKIAETQSPVSFLEALHSEQTNLILEIKPASPSKGVLVESFDVLDLLRIYNRYADGLSVLTDEKYFKGSLSLLEKVIANTNHPVLCKEFVIDPYQLYEARLHGASAILLIVKILTAEQLASLHQCALDLSLTPIIEIQNTEELECALEVSPEVLLINNRNLKTFQVTFETTQQLAPQVPAGIRIISASGIETIEDIRKLRPYTGNFLIGSTLMQTPVEQLDEKLKALAGL